MEEKIRWDLFGPRKKNHLNRWHFSWGKHALEMKQCVCLFFVSNAYILLLPIIDWISVLLFSIFVFPAAIFHFYKSIEFFFNALSLLHVSEWRAYPSVNPSNHCCCCFFFIKTAFYWIKKKCQSSITQIYNANERTKRIH